MAQSGVKILQLLKYHTVSTVAAPHVPNIGYLLQDFPHTPWTTKDY